MANLGNPKNTIEIIQKYEFMFQKKFGQNFLIDTHVLEKIISAAGITKNDCVLEIGPGIGTMTQYLAERAGHVVAVEIDKASNSAHEKFPPVKFILPGLNICIPKQPVICKEFTKSLPKKSQMQQMRAFMYSARTFS